MRRFVVLSIMSVVLAFPIPAHADPEVVALYEYAAANDWGPEEWAEFDRWVDWVRLLDIIDRANAGDRYAIEQYVWLLWGDLFHEQMGRIITRESGWNPAAKNPRSTASGLTQQLDIHAWRYARRGWDWNTDRFNAVKNLEIAFELWSESGWKPWACC